jgi:hypothetical protein
MMTMKNTTIAAKTITNAKSPGSTVEPLRQLPTAVPFNTVFDVRPLLAF